MCESTLSTAVPPTGSLVLPAMWVKTIRNSYQVELAIKKNTEGGIFNWKMKLVSMFHKMMLETRGLEISFFKQLNKRENLY